MAGQMEALRKKLESQEKVSVDRDLIKKEWLEAIETLYAKINGWLADLARDGLVSIEKKPWNGDEESTGQYTTFAMVIKTAGGVAVELQPYARAVFGAQGRVNAICGGKEFMLIRKSGNEWSISKPGQGVISPTPEPLNQESFAAMLQRLIP